MLGREELNEKLGEYYKKFVDGGLSAADAQAKVRGAMGNLTAEQLLEPANQSQVFATLDAAK